MFANLSKQEFRKTKNKFEATIKEKEEQVGELRKVGGNYPFHNVSELPFETE